MEARHRVERLVAALRAQQVMRAQPNEHALQRIRDFALVPVRLVELAEHRELLGMLDAVLLEPAAEPLQWRKRSEAAQMRKLALELFSDLLDEQIAEGNAAQAFLAVGNRIEHRAVAVRGAHRRVDVDERLDMRAHRARERHLDEDDRLLGQLRMKEREAAPVGFQAPAQIAPALD